MKVSDLKKAGFTVEYDTEGVRCTTITRDTLFWFFNPRFDKTPHEVMRRLSVVDNGEGRSKLCAAGHYHDDDEFPFITLESRDVDIIKMACEQAQALTAAIEKLQLQRTKTLHVGQSLIDQIIKDHGTQTTDS